MTTASTSQDRLGSVFVWLLVASWAVPLLFNGVWTSPIWLAIAGLFGGLLYAFVRGWAWAWSFLVVVEALGLVGSLVSASGWLIVLSHTVALVLLFSPPVRRRNTRYVESRRPPPI